MVALARWSSYSSLLCPLARWSQDTPPLIGPSHVIMSLVHNKSPSTGVEERWWPWPPWTLPPATSVPCVDTPCQGQRWGPPLTGQHRRSPAVCRSPISHSQLMQATPPTIQNATLELCEDTLYQLGKHLHPGHHLMIEVTNLLFHFTFLLLDKFNTH